MANADASERGKRYYLDDLHVGQRFTSGTTLNPGASAIAVNTNGNTNIASELSLLATAPQTDGALQRPGATFVTLVAERLVRDWRLDELVAAEFLKVV